MLCNEIKINQWSDCLIMKLNIVMKYVMFNIAIVHHHGVMSDIAIVHRHQGVMSDIAIVHHYIERVHWLILTLYTIMRMDLASMDRHHQCCLDRVDPRQ